MGVMGRLCGCIGGPQRGASGHSGALLKRLGGKREREGRRVPAAARLRPPPAW